MHHNFECRCLGCQALDDAHRLACLTELLLAQDINENNLQCNRLDLLSRVATIRHLLERRAA